MAAQFVGRIILEYTAVIGNMSTRVTRLKDVSKWSSSSRRGRPMILSPAISFPTVSQSPYVLGANLKTLSSPSPASPEFQSDS